MFQDFRSPSVPLQVPDIGGQRRTLFLVPSLPAESVADHHLAQLLATAADALIWVSGCGGRGSI